MNFILQVQLVSRLKLTFSQHDGILGISHAEEGLTFP